MTTPVLALICFLGVAMPMALGLLRSQRHQAHRASDHGSSARG
ncbi:hypothetical protein [Plantibacter sp. VKM Ac-2880]|nr:hypothetical protein [Plantibacter sp. VKM Ac-2880]